MRAQSAGSARRQHPERELGNRGDQIALEHAVLMHCTLAQAGKKIEIIAVNDKNQNEDTRTKSEDTQQFLIVELVEKCRTPRMRRTVTAGRCLL